MSTRAMYTFKDQYSEFHVYKHCDGYPSGAAQWIAAAFEFAWMLPRFEADEFAAAFVAANKKESGGVYLVPSGDWKTVGHGDIDYRYVITITKADPVQLHITAYTVRQGYKAGQWTSEEIFDGPLAAFQLFQWRAVGPPQRQKETT